MLHRKTAYSGSKILVSNSLLVKKGRQIQYLITIMPSKRMLICVRRQNKR